MKKALLEEPPDMRESGDDIPCGLMYIHAMYLADIFSDDSNFHTLVMDHIVSKPLAIKITSIHRKRSH